MAQILPRDLSEVPGGVVNPNAANIVDDGSGVFKATPAQIVASGFPVASQPEAEAGAINNKAMTPQRVKQAIDALGVSQDALASTMGGGMVGTPDGSDVGKFVTGTAIVVRPTGGSDVANFNAALAAGTTIYARNGTFIFTQRIDITGKTVDFTGSTIIYTGWTGGSGTSSADAAFFIGSGTTIIGGTFNGGNSPGQWGRILGSNIIVKDVTIKAFAREGMRVYAGSSNVLIQNAAIENIGVGQAASNVCNGIYITGDFPGGLQTRGVIVRGGSISNINYANHRLGVNDTNGILILGTDGTLVMDPSDPTYSNAVVDVLIDGVSIQQTDRRAIKMQSSFVTVINCKCKDTGGIRPVGAGKKLKGLKVTNNTLENCEGFANGGVMLIDSIFAYNTFNGVTSSFWRAESGGMAARCVVAYNVCDMNGASADGTSNCMYVGAFANNGFYDQSLTFTGNKFYRAGNIAHTADNALPIRVSTNGSNIVMDNNVVRLTDPSLLTARLSGTATRFVNNDIPTTTTGSAGVVRLDATDIEYRGNSPSGLAKGTVTIASGATTATLTHNLAVFGTSGVGAVFTTDGTAFPTPSRSAVAITIEPTNIPTNPVNWAITATASNSVTLTLTGDPGASGFSFRWKAQVLG